MEQAELLRRLVDILEEQGVTYLLVGSLASGVYGEPRFTHDIDVVIEIRPDQVSRLCAAFPAPEYDVSETAAREVVVEHRQFNVVHTTSGNTIDFIVARPDAWGRAQIARRRREQILPGCLGYAASPEDVILGKLLYYREGGSEKHLRDVAAMLQVSGEEIDRGYIEQWTGQLGLMEAWQAVLDRLHRHE